jgi:hypothetical protein
LCQTAVTMAQWVGGGRKAKVYKAMRATSVASQNPLIP